MILEISILLVASTSLVLQALPFLRKEEQVVVQEFKKVETAAHQECSKCNLIVARYEHDIETGALVCANCLVGGK